MYDKKLALEILSQTYQASQTILVGGLVDEF